MVFKIRNADVVRITKGFEVLTAQRSILEDQVRVFNEAVAAARAILQEGVDAFNEQVNVVRGVIEDVHSELEEEFDGKSDGWRESDKGSTVHSWIEEIDTFVQNLNEADLDSFPDSLEFETVIGDDPAEEFEELDKEPIE